VIRLLSEYTPQHLRITLYFGGIQRSSLVAELLFGSIVDFNGNLSGTHFLSKFFDFLAGGGSHEEGDFFEFCFCFGCPFHRSDSSHLGCVSIVCSYFIG
jgi:hypothetical protein